MKYYGKFKCIIISPRRLIYQNEIQSIFLSGDQGEFEILAYHYPLLAVLKRSNVVIDWTEAVPILGGIVRFFANECVIMVEDEIRTLKDEG